MLYILSCSSTTALAGSRLLTGGSHLSCNPPTSFRSVVNVIDSGPVSGLDGSGRWWNPADRQQEVNLPQPASFLSRLWFPFTAPTSSSNSWHQRRRSLTITYRSTPTTVVILYSSLFSFSLVSFYRTRAVVRFVNASMFFSLNKAESLSLTLKMSRAVC